MKFHPLAELFPLIEGADFDALVADIKANGQREPIIIYQEQILDGRNRYRACLAAGVGPVSKQYGGDDPIGLVVSLNLRRRHLDESQRAMVAARLATLPKGSNQHASIEAPSQDRAADLLNVSRSGVQRARTVLEQASPEIVKAVENGKISVSQAAIAARLSHEKQEVIAREAAAGRANAVRGTIKRERRQERETELAKKIMGESTAIEALTSEQEWLRVPTDEALRVGRAAEHLVCADALMRGWNAFLSGQGSPYDLVLEKEGRMFRVQVKCAQWARDVNYNGQNERIAYSFAALRRGKNGDGPRLTNKEADLIACVALDIGVIAYIPVSECTSTIQLDAERIPDNNYVRTYDRPVREYPLERAIARLESAQHYIELQKVFPPFPRKRYGVLYADPPWAFNVWSEQGMDRSADNHYPTVPTDVLCGVGPFLPVGDDAVLFLWATSPMLPDAFKLMAAWGFVYKTSMIWEKDKAGTGYWFRNKHELLLVGTRGNVPCPAPGENWSSVLIQAPVKDHSEKPDDFYELIEAYFPTLPKIELNARRPRENWDSWGLDAAWSLPQREAAE